VELFDFQRCKRDEKFILSEPNRYFGSLSMTIGLASRRKSLRPRIRSSRSFGG